MYIYTRLYIYIYISMQLYRFIDTHVYTLYVSSCVMTSCDHVSWRIVPIGDAFGSPSAQGRIDAPGAAPATGAPNQG